jgi:hypothetical protein
LKYNGSPVGFFGRTKLFKVLDSDETLIMRADQSISQKVWTSLVSSLLPIVLRDGPILIAQWTSESTIMPRRHGDGVTGVLVILRPCDLEPLLAIERHLIDETCTVISPLKSPVQRRA